MSSKKEDKIGRIIRKVEIGRAIRIADEKRRSGKYGPTAGVASSRISHDISFTSFDKIPITELKILINRARKEENNNL